VSFARVENIPLEIVRAEMGRTMTAGIVAAVEDPEELASVLWGPAGTLSAVDELGAIMRLVNAIRRTIKSVRKRIGSGLLRSYMGAVTVV
jgi:hypothetical protein